MTKRDYSLLFGGNASHKEVGILLLHGLGGTPLELKVVARGLAARGYTVSCCQLAGHCGSEQDLLATNWADWFASAECARGKRGSAVTACSKLDRAPSASNCRSRINPSA